jgi:hypothetical protein
VCAPLATPMNNPKNMIVANRVRTLWIVFVFITFIPINPLTNKREEEKTPVRYETIPGYLTIGPDSHRQTSNLLPRAAPSFTQHNEKVCSSGQRQKFED